MVEAGDFIWSIYVYTFSIYIKYLAYMASLMAIFASGTYLARTYEIDITAGCI